MAPQSKLSTSANLICARRHAGTASSARLGMGCTIPEQGETFPLILGNAAESPMVLLRFATSQGLAQIQAEQNSLELLCTAWECGLDLAQMPVAAMPPPSPYVPGQGRAGREQYYGLMGGEARGAAWNSCYARSNPPFPSDTEQPSCLLRLRPHLKVS